MDKRADPEATKPQRLALRFEVLVSTLVGLLALGTSAYTAHIQRQQLKMQAWPHLMIVGESSGSQGVSTLTLSLKNRGIAPARVRYVRVAVADEVVSDWSAWIARVARRQGVDFQIPDFGMWDSPEGSVIAPGEATPLFTTSSPEMISLLVADRDTSISICYCSVLDDCWAYQSIAGATDTTSAVEACPANGAPFVGRPKDTEREWVRRLREATRDGGAGADLKSRP